MVDNFLLSVQLENVIIHKSLKPTNKTYQMPRKRIFGHFEKKERKRNTLNSNLLDIFMEL